jgi:hypothetical protein
LIVGFCSAFQAAFKWRSNYASRTALNDVPLELTGKLDPSRKWDVTLEFQGETKVISIDEGTSVLEASEKIWDGRFHLLWK